MSQRLRKSALALLALVLLYLAPWTVVHAQGSAPAFSWVSVAGAWRLVFNYPLDFVQAIRFNNIRFVLPGQDYGLAVNGAIADCANSCTVRVATGGYTSATTITYNPPSSLGQVNLLCEGPGTILNYTGSGDALFVSNQLTSGTNFEVENCRFDGTNSSGSANGIHFGNNNGGYLNNVVITNFKGDAFYCQGCNQVTIVNPVFTGNNGTGVHLVSATGATPNAITILGGNIGLNKQWCFWDDGTNGLGQGSGNSLHGVVCDGNGSSASTGNVRIDNAAGDGIYGGYYEYFGGSTSTTNIQIGTASLQALGFTINGAFFTSTNATNTITDTNSIGTHISGVAEGANLTGYVYSHGTLSRKSTFDCNNFVYGSALGYIGGVDTGNDTAACYGPAGWPNSFQPSSNGFAFNQLNLENGVAFASLPSAPANGTLVYCTNCTIANPCAAAGTGAIAKRLNGTWVCN